MQDPKFGEFLKRSNHSDQAVGTPGGTSIAVIDFIDYGDILKTGILAGVGAVVSYAVSRLMQKWFGKRPPDKR